MSEKLQKLHQDIEQMRNAFNPNGLADILNGFLSILDGGAIVQPGAQNIPQQQEPELSREEQTQKIARENAILFTAPNCICCDSNENTQIQRLPSSQMEEALCGRCAHLNAMPKEWYIDQLIQGIDINTLYQSPHTVWIEGKYIRFAERSES